MAFKMKTGGGTANADTPGPFSSSNTTTVSKLMKNLPIGSKERYDEYERRGWAHDETTTAPFGKEAKIDLRKWQKTDDVKDIKYIPRN